MCEEQAKLASCSILATSRLSPLDSLKRPRQREMILTNCAACAAPLAHDAPRCVRCKVRYCNALCGTQIYGAFVLNRRVDLHAIDATPARRRGGVGSSPLDGSSTATSSPRCIRHWLISTQVVSNRSFAKLAALEPDAVLLSGDLSYADGWPWRWDSRGRGVPPSRRRDAIDAARLAGSAPSRPRCSRACPCWSPAATTK